MRRYPKMEKKIAQWSESLTSGQRACLAEVNPGSVNAYACAVERILAYPTDTEKEQLTQQRAFRSLKKVGEELYPGFGELMVDSFAVFLGVPLVAQIPKTNIHKSWPNGEKPTPIPRRSYQEAITSSLSEEWEDPALLPAQGTSRHLYGRHVPRGNSADEIVGDQGLRNLRNTYESRWMGREPRRDLFDSVAPSRTQRDR